MRPAVINRIRDIRKQKNMTLAEVAAACDPPTTAQTIGRLETGMRNLSLGWMNKIGKALGVDPELLVRGEAGEQPKLEMVRFRTLGCYPLTGALRSTATTLPDIIREMLLTKYSERQGRLIDHDEEASMEAKKREGYF